MVCKKCGCEASKGDNFCTKCGTRIGDKCSFCWVRKKSNYDCGEQSCPGFGLYKLEKSKANKACSKLLSGKVM